jgi:hypothetical protein
VEVLIFMPVYLESCTWPDVILRWIRQRNSIKCCAYPEQVRLETLAMIRQAFGEESMSRNGKYKLTDTENSETREQQSQEHAHHFSLTSRGLFTMNSS